ncbi:MAG: hypothetical protein ABI629_05555 [bacterium]
MRRLGWLLASVLLIAAGPAAACTGDCDGDGQVAINEAIRGVNIALGNALVSDCASFDANGDGSVAVSELIAAVSNVLGGCASATPGPTPTTTPATDGAATLVIEKGAGTEFVTGRSYAFDLADIRPGNLVVALYQGTLNEMHPLELGDLTLRQTLLDAAGNIIRDGAGRRRIIRLQFRHVPLRTGTFHCGDAAIAEIPGLLLTFDASATLRDDAQSSETSLDDYFGYPRPTDLIDCTLTITSLADGVMVGTYTSHMLSAEADDLAYATGTLALPQPVCTVADATASPQTCYPWAF